MATKKGQCPVGFLWSGHGLGLFLMKTSLTSFLMAILIKVVALMSSYPLNVQGLLLATIALWGLGKAWSCLGELKDGAQKRTRTSTK